MQNVVEDENPILMGFDGQSIPFIILRHSTHLIIESHMKLLSTLLFSSLVALSSPTVAQTWQSSMSMPVIELGVRDKWGEAQKKLVFEVVGPGQRKFTKTMILDGDEFATVVWPRDFGPAAQSAHIGNYKWAAIVDGKKAVNGEFSYKY